MNKIGKYISEKITKCIDFFYRPFSRLIPEQIFRYAACGGANLVLDWVLYFLIYNFVIGHEIINLQFSIFNFQFEQAMTPHIAALCIVFPITLLTGFWLQKYVTFTQNLQTGEESSDKSHTSEGFRQLLRYILIVAINLAINYFGLKLCVEHFGWYPTPSKMLITLFTVLISFLGQKYYTFKAKN